MDELREEIFDMLDTGWTDEQIIGSLLRLYQIETAEARATLDEALREYMQSQCPF